MGYEVRTGLEDIESTTGLVRRWRWRRAGLFLLLALAVIVIIGGTTSWLRDGLQIPLVDHSQPRSVDVIIVLGAGTTKTGNHLPLQAKQRVLEGVSLLQSGYASMLIMSGGYNQKTGLVEATEMTAYAQSQGVSNEHIIPETESRDTFENSIDSRAIMAAHGWRTALVVTSPYHTWRACQIFRKQGAEVACVAAPYTTLPAKSFDDRLRDTWSVIREYGAIVYNRLKGEI